MEFESNIFSNYLIHITLTITQLFRENALKNRLTIKIDSDSV